MPSHIQQSTLSLRFYPRPAGAEVPATASEVRRPFQCHPNSLWVLDQTSMGEIIEGDYTSLPVLAELKHWPFTWL